MARKMAAGELETTWFERHRSTPITELPHLAGRLPAPGRTPHGANREQPVHQPHRAPRIQAPLEHRTLGRAGKARHQELLAARPPGGRALLAEPQLQTTRTLADRAQFDAVWMQVAELYRGYAGFDVPALVAELVEAEAVPFSCCATRPAAAQARVWERTWERQRREDH